MKKATAYKKNSIIITPLSMTTAGVWIASSPAVSVAEDKVRSVLGVAVLDALAASQHGVAHPSQADWEKVAEPVLKLANAKSWNAFAMGAKCVGIELSTNRVSFVPRKNEGPRGGFSDIEEQRRDCPPVAESVGAALTEAFEDAQ